jgi:hypothetical protein
MAKPGKAPKASKITQPWKASRRAGQIALNRRENGMVNLQRRSAGKTHMIADRPPHPLLEEMGPQAYALFIAQVAERQAELEVAGITRPNSYNESGKPVAVLSGNHKRFMRDPRNVCGICRTLRARNGACMCS